MDRFVEERCNSLLCLVAREVHLNPFRAYMSASNLLKVFIDVVDVRGQT